jgi:hypothetical protein
LFSYANINTLFGLDLFCGKIKIPVSDIFALRSQIVNWGEGQKAEDRQAEGRK